MHLGYLRKRKMQQKEPEREKKKVDTELFHFKGQFYKYLALDRDYWYKLRDMK
jgi:hypothetical protein